ncbi:DnaJ-domain-containing protein [Ceratobasidium sp. AG-I]|nr:DnaJ-domain-containing protein [Ceratobasidium sp. AG-I]
MAPSPPPDKTSEPASSKPEPPKPTASTSTAKLGSGPSTATDAKLADDLDRLLAREATALQRDIEVERILKAFKLNSYEILGLYTDATQADIKKRYRQLSLFIHPDKTTHERATDAFDLLKKAEAELSDQAKRDDLDAVMLEARAQALKAASLPIGISDTDSRVLELVPSLRDQVRARAKEMLIEEELRRRKAVKMNLANEGLEARRKEEESATKKRKAEEDARWEGTHSPAFLASWQTDFIGALAENREHRVDSWRTFNTGKKKKKSKVNVIG